MTEIGAVRAQVRQILIALAATRTTGDKADARELAAAFQVATALRHCLDAAAAAAGDQATRAEALGYAAQYAEWAAEQARGVLDEIALHDSLATASPDADAGDQRG